MNQTNAPSGQQRQSNWRNVLAALNADRTQTAISAVLLYVALFCVVKIAGLANVMTTVITSASKFTAVSAAVMYVVIATFAVNQLYGMWIEPSTLVQHKHISTYLVGINAIVCTNVFFNLEIAARLIQPFWNAIVLVTVIWAACEINDYRNTFHYVVRFIVAAVCGAVGITLLGLITYAIYHGGSGEFIALMIFAYGLPGVIVLINGYYHYCAYYPPGQLILFKTEIFILLPWLFLSIFPTSLLHGPGSGNAPLISEVWVPLSSMLLTVLFFAAAKSALSKLLIALPETTLRQAIGAARDYITQEIKIAGAKQA